MSNPTRRRDWRSLGNWGRFYRNSGNPNALRGRGISCDCARALRVRRRLDSSIGHSARSFIGVLDFSSLEFVPVDASEVLCWQALALGESVWVAARLFSSKSESPRVFIILIMVWRYRDILKSKLLQGSANRQLR